MFGEPDLGTKVKVIKMRKRQDEKRNKNHREKENIIFHQEYSQWENIQLQQGENLGNRWPS